MGISISRKGTARPSLHGQITLDRIATGPLDQPPAPRVRERTETPAQARRLGGHTAALAVAVTLGIAAAGLVIFDHLAAGETVMTDDAGPEITRGTTVPTTVPTVGATVAPLVVPQRAEVVTAPGSDLMPDISGVIDALRGE